MNVSGVTSATGALPNMNNNNLGKDAFMKILVAQLGNQDPLSPLEDKDFIAQVAQFSMLEEIQSLNNNFNQLRTFNYLGKNVTALVNENETGVSQVIEGVVDSISLSGKDMILHVGDRVLKPENIIGVSNEE